jgi:hypothetical protein
MEDIQWALGRIETKIDNLEKSYLSHSTSDDANFKDVRDRLRLLEPVLDRTELNGNAIESIEARVAAMEKVKLEQSGAAAAMAERAATINRRLAWIVAAISAIGTVVNILVRSRWF